VAVYDDFGFPVDPSRQCTQSTRAGRPCTINALKVGRVQHKSGAWVEMTLTSTACGYHTTASAAPSG